MTTLAINAWEIRKAITLCGELLKTSTASCAAENLHVDVEEGVFR